ncbi:Pyruvate/ketoisovalerate oxidoreductase, catalytic domain [[Clostridium] cellulosi]|jgi:2-oxoglutarate ferredoxin oxidoreductase, gamma subunit (EC 1.2.7.3)|uniref:Pyruvate/ketoisovalerate oxidoreductase, catalytic domain n=1 Tax=[Clostridium] cellulosi TaxID=29343 RepID=A0A078KRL0_9FIRM|nr:MAG: 2-oxoacid:ferredoxin oxidoreductase subunit gamma [[Clostridium] cellulosi]CDZ23764.1 Pyruvate/ketoisovalerate oxidoreductase, catalytic domain [[Clostridium] cellulosi]
MAFTHSILLAGFGGQGILFAGKVIAYAGLVDGREVSWLPSYGPEMRGGTANCSVTISDEPIGSPLIINPSILIAMNLPSLDKFINNVIPGGIVIVDSTLINKKVERTDVKTFYVPATGLADEKGLRGLANMIILGKLLKETKFADYDSVIAGLRKSVPPRKAQLIDSNIKAIGIGMEL